MKMTNLESRSVDELVEMFKSMALEQDDALLDSDVKRFTRLFWRMDKVEAELKARAGDQRRALLVLYDHHNAQVRLSAANTTLAVVPEVARKKLQTIANSREYPRAGDTGMSLWALEEGISKPT